MEYSIATYFLYFIILSICGWIMEVSLGLIQRHKFSDRGFLIGPYCPIYGCGGLLITLCLSSVKEHPIILFFMAILVSGVLEYSTSVIMEKIFHARWWDYSNNKFNINGRVCLETIIPFGILGVTLIYIVNPFIFENLAKLPETLLNIISITIAVLFFADFIVSFKVVSNVRAATARFDRENPKDNTDEISKKVREFLTQKSVLNRRLVNAFPTLTATLKKQGEKIKKKTEEMTESISNKAEEVKEGVKNKVVEMKEDFNTKSIEIKKDFTAKVTKISKKKKEKR